MARKFITVKWSIDKAREILEVLDSTMSDLEYLVDDYESQKLTENKDYKLAKRDLDFFSELREKIKQQIGSDEKPATKKTAKKAPETEEDKKTLQKND